MSDQDKTQTTRLKVSIEELLLIAMEHKRSIIFADANHSVVPQRIDKLLSSPKLLSQFSENGYHGYFRETSLDARAPILNLLSHKTDAAQFAEDMMNLRGGYSDVPTTHQKTSADKTAYLRDSFAPLVQQLDRFGIGTIPADIELDLYQDEFDFLYEKATPEQKQEFEKKSAQSLSLDDNLNDLRKIVYPDGTIPEYMRLSKDPDVSMEIKKRMEDLGTERVFGMYGAGHTFHSQAIQKNFKDMFVILAMDNMESYPLIKTKFEARSKEKANESEGFPGFVYDTETGSVFATPNADPALLKKIQDLEAKKTPAPSSAPASAPEIA